MIGSVRMMGVGSPVGDGAKPVMTPPLETTEIEPIGCRLVIGSVSPLSNQNTLPPMASGTLVIATLTTWLFTAPMTGWSGWVSATVTGAYVGSTVGVVAGATA